MHFTRTRDEIHIGVEFCCDTCNRYRADEPIANNWWYLRYNKKDKFPSMWVCPQCKESFE